MNAVRWPEKSGSLISIFDIHMRAYRGIAALKRAPIERYRLELEMMNYGHSMSRGPQFLEENNQRAAIVEVAYSWPASSWASLQQMMKR